MLPAGALDDKLRIANDCGEKTPCPLQLWMAGDDMRPAIGGKADWYIVDRENAAPRLLYRTRALDTTAGLRYRSALPAVVAGVYRRAAKKKEVSFGKVLRLLAAVRAWSCDG